MRDDSATRSIPVLLVSAHRDEADMVKGFSLGADDYVTKPFNSGELMARINRALRTSDGSDEATKPPDLPGSPFWPVVM